MLAPKKCIRKLIKTKNKNKNSFNYIELFALTIFFFFNFSPILILRDGFLRPDMESIH